MELWDSATTHRKETRISLLCVKRLWLQPWYKRLRITPPHTSCCSPVWRRKKLDPILCWPKCGEVSLSPPCADPQLCPTLSTPARQPWDFPGKNTGVGCHFLLQGIFPTQGPNLGLRYCRQTLYHLSYGLNVIGKAKQHNILSLFPQEI